MRDPCGPCGLCCRSYLVPLFGHDVWQIATRRNLSPESFAFIAEQEEPDALGFRLTAPGPTYGLALMKIEPITATQPCIFLEGVDQGYTRCGIYADRPITCRSYPMSKLGGRVFQRERTLCPPGSWTDEDTIAPQWVRTLQQLRMRRDIYVEVVARWNAAVERWQPPGMLPPKLFCDYLLLVYGKIAAMEEEIGGESLDRLEAEWARVDPRPSSTAPEVAAGRDEEPGWISHFRRVRDLIDGFFPELPPLPFQSVLVEAS